MKRKHPIQNIREDEGARGRRRFVENKIVSHLLDHYPGGLNKICQKFDGGEYREDYDQLIQLIGYSLDGFWEISSGSGRTMMRTVAAADRMKPPIPLHVHPTINKKWVVRKKGHVLSLKKFKTEEAAFNWAVRKSFKWQCDVYLHHPDGSIKATATIA